MNVIYQKIRKKDAPKPRPKGNIEDILVIGIENPHTSLALKKSIAKSSYEITNINNPFKAYRWLENYTKTNHKLPSAILCGLNFLEGDDYSFLTSIQNNKLLKLIPFILVGDEPTQMDSMSALRRGIDDFYTAPLEWEDIENRIRFLKMFKTERAKLNLTEETSYEKEAQKITPKRVFDIVFSVGVLIGISPLLLLIAAMIKLESRGKGKVFYASQRVGSGYKVFNFYKFRSMREGADKELKKLEHLNQYSDKKEDNAFVKLKNDPRVTFVGRLIRKTSLDELPQFFNVLKGDMSIVGNRPLPLYEAEQLTKDEWSQRFLAPAGITGLWQVTKRGKDNMSVKERMELDIEYAEKYSLWYDLKIISKTIPAMLQHESV
ncbi:MAG: sugar transferase [Chitinophagales bacterium]